MRRDIAMTQQLRASVVIYLSILLSFGSTTGEEKPTPITVILGAFDEEVKILEEKLTGSFVQKIQGISFLMGKMSGRRVVIVRSGVGKVNAAMTATLLIEHFKPNEVIFTGVAGGINPDLLPGDIVIAVRVAQHDLGTLTENGFVRWGARNPVNGRRNPVFFPADSVLLTIAEACSKSVDFEKIQTNEKERDVRIIRGIIVTGDAFISSPSKKMSLRQDLEADAVEMEGASVAQVCWQQGGVPCLIIRSLSDTAGENAEREAKAFYKIAAHNSAKLVHAIIEQLNLPQATKTVRQVKN